MREGAINLPNLITLLRIALIPVVLTLVFSGTPRSNVYAALVYTLAAVSDFLDGWLARRNGLITLLGRLLDPLADKLLVVSVLVFLIWMGRVPLQGVVASILIFSREFWVSSLRVLAMGEGVIVASRRSGKDKTALQMVALFALIMHHPYQLDFLFTRVEVDMNTVGLWLLYLSLIPAIASALQYSLLLFRPVDVD